MDRTRHSVTSFMNIERPHTVINNKLFNRLGHINDQLYEVGLAKSEVENKEPIILLVFILQYAKLRMMELYYNYCIKFRGTDKNKEMKLYGDSLYLAVTEGRLYDCLGSEKNQERE